MTDGDYDNYNPTAMLDALLQAGADARVRDRGGNTVLHLLRFDPKDYAEDLRDAHLQVNSGTLSGDADIRTALPALSSLIDRLVQHGADVNARNNAGQTALEALEEHCTGYPGDKMEQPFKAALERLVARLAAKQGTSAAPPSPITAPAPALAETDPASLAEHRAAETCLLAWAVRHDNIPAALAALKSGGDPQACFMSKDHEAFRTAETPQVIPLPAPAKDEHDPMLLYPIFFAATPDMVEALADAGVDINARDPAGDTALLFQAGGGETDLYQNAPMSDDRTLDAATITALVQARADVNTHDKDGDTPLLLLPHCYHTDYYGDDDTDAVVWVIQLLAQHGADVNARNNAGQTVLQVTENDLGKPLTASDRKILSALRSLGALDGPSARGSGRPAHRSRKGG